MKFCTNCGKPIAEDAKFCAACGAAIAEAGPTSQPEKKKSKAPLIIGIVAVVVLLLAGGGYAASKLMGFGSGKESAKESEKESRKESKKSSKSSKKTSDLTMLFDGNEEANVDVIISSNLDMDISEDEIVMMLEIENNEDSDLSLSVSGPLLENHITAHIDYDYDLIAAGDTISRKLTITDPYEETDFTELEELTLAFTLNLVGDKMAYYTDDAIIRDLQGKKVKAVAAGFDFSSDYSEEMSEDEAQNVAEGKSFGSTKTGFVTPPGEGWRPYHEIGSESGVCSDGEYIVNMINYQDDDVDDIAKSLCESHDVTGVAYIDDVVERDGLYGHMITSKYRDGLYLTIFVFTSDLSDGDVIYLAVESSGGVTGEEFATVTDAIIESHTMVP